MTTLDAKGKKGQEKEQFVIRSLTEELIRPDPINKPNHWVHPSKLTDAELEALAVEHPPHYILNDGTECIDVIKAHGWFPDYCRSSALKYLWRSQHKGAEVKDLRKAAQCLVMLADWLDKKEKGEDADDTQNAVRLEFREAGSQIIAWANKGQGWYCYSIARFESCKDGLYDLRFVGDRPLDETINWAEFRVVVQKGFDYLEAEKGETT